MFWLNLCSKSHNKTDMRRILCSISIVLFLFTAACSNVNNQKRNNETTIPTEAVVPRGAVPFEYRHHLYFNVLLRDSIPARMIFDTGNTHLLIDSTFYATSIDDKSNLRRSMLRGAGGGVEIANIDAGGWKYRVGEKSQNEQMAVVMNLRKILGGGVDGMFGMKYMQGERVEFNYADNYMRILSADETISDDFTRIQCKWLDDSQMRILVPLSLAFGDGFAYEGEFMVDMGMSGSLSLNSTIVDKLKQHLPEARSLIYTVGGVGGSRVDNVFKAQQVTIGNKTVKDVRAVWSGNKEGAMADCRYDGVIGNELLERYDIVCDFVECAIYTRPNRNFSAPQNNDLGIVLTPYSEYWIVNGLLQGGNAEKAGLKRGDIIKSINGIGANDERAKNLYPFPDKLQLSVQRGNSLIEIIFDKE